MIEKLKQALQTNFWEQSAYRNVYFQTHFNGMTLNGCLELAQGQTLDDFDLERTRACRTGLAQWDLLSRTRLQQAHPDADISQLQLKDLVLYPDGRFQLGYDGGETDAGQVYLYIRFSKDQKPEEEIIYEVY